MNNITDFLGWHAAQKGMTREEYTAYFLSESKNIKTFEAFVKEGAINAGPESEVVIDDMITHNGTEISSEEILGIVISSDNDKQVEDKIREKYGELAFSTEDISKIVQYYNDYSAEQKEKELEAEKEAEGGEGGDDPLAGI